MKLVYWPSPVLKQVSQPVKAMVQSMIDEMYTLMKAHEGVGLSAIQVGFPLRFFILDVGAGLEVFTNPVIEKLEGVPRPVKEGCLSIPGFYDKVVRYPQVTVSYDDGGFQRQSSTYDGLRAQVIQHESEHLDGKLFIDRLTNAKRSTIMGNIQALKRAGRLK